VSGDRDTVTAVTAVTEVGALNRGPARDSVLLGKYRVEHTLGFGGMGLVVQAHNMPLDERVAIKFLREDVAIDDGHIERFLREAKAAVRLKSEHVAKIRDVGTLENGRPYIVMELLEGLDLGKLLDDMGSLPTQRAIDLLLQTCDAIAEAHANGIIHRDIKPTNLFLTRRRDGSDLVKVLDFGISKIQQGPEMALTQTSNMLGTPAYMSPEQMRSARTADPRSDIWALGTVLYELVEGRPPFRASNFAELCVLVSTEPPDPLEKAPELANVFSRCLAKSVEHRYQDVAELAFDLEPFASDLEHARRQANRIARTLGKQLAANRISSPAIRRDPTGIPQTPVPGQCGATPSITYDEPRRSRWKVVALLVGLFGVGIGAGLYATNRSSTSSDSDSTGSGSETATSATPQTAPDGGSAVTVAIDAGVAEAFVVDAGLAHDAGIAPSSDHSPKRQPPKRPPRPPPPPPPPPPEQEDPPVVAPPPVVPEPKCDPFDNKNGCKKSQ
jgi:eukaryotic-like serine/threonine-protein kinase